MLSQVVQLGCLHLLPTRRIQVPAWLWVLVCGAFVERLQGWGCNVSEIFSHHEVKMGIH